MCRNRRSLGLNLKDPAARDALIDLVGTADVLIEGLRPGVAERLGFGPDVCLGRNECLIYGRMTGWGQDGPTVIGQVMTSTTSHFPAPLMRLVHAAADRFRH